MNTEGFKPSEATMNTVPDGGVSASIRQLDIPEVDFAKEMVDLITAVNGFKANLKTIQTQNEIAQSILDIKA